MVELNLKLPDGYLHDEIRGQIHVSSKTKEIWAVELDLLAEFERVCKKYNISFCADGGTLLGAIRHHGFIPWDDDLDIAVLRENYEKLCEIGPDEFKYPYFWQTEETDPGSARCHAQLRNSLTTGILKSEYSANLKFNQGIFIDIFPFDTVGNDYNSQLRECVNLREKLYWQINDTFNYNPKMEYKSNGIPRIKNYVKKHAVHVYSKLTHADYKETYKEFENLCKKYDANTESKFVADVCIPFNNTIRNVRNREDFDDLMPSKFEFLTIPVFRNYDRNLRRLYGDNYMTPMNMASQHGDIIFDTDKPYTEYLKIPDSRI